MKRKNGIILALVAVVLAAVLTAMLLPRPEQTPQGRPQPSVLQTQPGQPEQTGPAPTAPEQTGQTEQTQQTEQTEPVVTTEPDETLPPEETEQTRPAEMEPVQTEPPTEPVQIFPVLLEDGMLTVQSIFSFSGMNPDADLLFEENIAGLQLTNTSDQHLTEAEITAVLSDGTILTFRVEELAPGMGAMVFSPEHATVEDPIRCVEVYGYAEFDEGDPLHSDLVELRVEGMAVTVKNVSGRDLTDLAIICHGLLDGSAFGGKTYTYRITSLHADASTTIVAQDCILGMTQVVRVELGE